MTLNTPTEFILAINPGSTSTKVALFDGENAIASESIKHPAESLDAFASLWDQFEYRAGMIQDFLSSHSHQLKPFAATVGRGGLLKPLESGTYLVSDDMVQDARTGVQGEHASNLGCGLADYFAKKHACPAFVVDPISVNEFDPRAVYSGHPLIKRRALSHALNIRAAAFAVMKQRSMQKQGSRFVVVHLGGGFSIAAVRDGKIVDVNDAASDGPFSPERSGGLPLQPFIDLCFSGDYTEAEIRKLVMGKGGMVAYLGTNDFQQVESRIDSGDHEARMVYEAMVYQIAKEIGGMATILGGDIDAVIITGGLANSHRLIVRIRNYVKFITTVVVLPGEMEMKAMANGVLRVLRREEKAKTY